MNFSFYKAKINLLSSLIHRGHYTLEKDTDLLTYLGSAVFMTFFYAFVFIVIDIIRKNNNLNTKALDSEF